MSELIVVSVNGENRLDSRVLATQLNYDHKVVLQSIRRHKNRLEAKSVLQRGVERSKISVVGRPEAYYMLDMCQCQILIGTLTNVPMEKLQLFADWFNVSVDAFIVVPRCQREEHAFGDQLKELLHGICPIIPQMEVDGYRIDYYLPSANIAIEYDEHHHKYQSKQDRKREEHIRIKLCCSFIRVKPGYSFPHVANQIMHALLKRSV